MSDFGSTDATINVEVDADATAAAAAIERALQKALVQAFKSKEVINAIAQLVNSTKKAGEGLGDATKNAFKQGQKAGDAFGKSMEAMFKKVARAAQDAFDFNKAGGKSELSALNASVQTISSSMKELGTASKQTIRTLEELGRQTRLQADLVERAARSQTLAAKAEAGERVAEIQKQTSLARGASNERVAIIRAASRQIIQIERAIGAAVQGVFRAASSVVRTFAHGAVAAIQGFSRSSSQSFAAIGRGLQAAFRGALTIVTTFTRGATSAISAFVRAGASLWRHLFSGFRSLLSRQESDLNASLQRQRQSISHAQSGLMSGRGLLGGAAALTGGAGLFGFLTSGFERAGEQERMQLTFEALLGDADAATAVLGRLSDYARTTSFDFLQMAETTAALTATMGDLGRAEEITHFLANITALSGGTNEQFGRARLAFEQIASAGRLYGGEIRQLRESLPAIPIVDILTEKFFGGDADAFGAALNAGELGFITSDAFFDAIEEGIAERFPGIENQAELMATTFTGLAQNIKENFAILGAAIIGALPGLKLAMKGLNTFFINATEFITGEMFKLGGAGSGENPFEGFLSFGGRQLIPFEELPPEMQDILHERNGWGPNGGFVIAKRDAEELWDALHPPDETALSRGMQFLKGFRDTLGTVGKALAGLLAIKGISEIFQLLGRGLRALFTAVGPDDVRRFSFLRTFSVGILGVIAAFSVFSRFSEKFAREFKKVKDLLGPTITSLKNLGTAFKNALGRSLEDKGGVGSILRGIGDSFSYVNRILAGVLRGITSFADTLAGLLNLKGFQDFFGSLDQAIGNGLAAAFGFDSWGKWVVEEKGGSAILNALELTFLEPVIKFFRGPFLNVAKTVVNFLRSVIRTIVGAVGNFFSDLFRNIFGGGESERGGFFGQVEDNLLGPQAERQSLGTRILDALDQTFLGPIVRFFRGPFADGVETVIGGIVGFGQGLFTAIFGDEEGSTLTRVSDFLSTTFLAPVVAFFGEGGGFQTVKDNIGSFFGGVGDVISGLWDTIGPIVQPLIDEVTKLIDAFKNWDFSELDLGNIAIGAGVGAAIGGVLGGIPGLVLGGLAGALSQTGLVGGILESIDNAWESLIKPALEGLWADISGFIADTFTVDNLSKAAYFLLDLLRQAGKLVGNIAGDPVFIGAIAGIGAAAVSVVTLFTLGFLQGVASNIDEWAQIIATGIEMAWDGMVDLVGFEASSDIPVIAAIGNWLKNILSSDQLSPYIAVGAIGLTGLIGGVLKDMFSTTGAGGKSKFSLGSIGATLIGSIFTGAQNAVRGVAGGAAGMIGGLFGKHWTPDQWITRVDGKLQGVGKSIGASIMAGVAIGIGGYAAGQTGSGNNIIMSILAGGATGAALGLTAGGPIGAGIGAVLGIGIAGITAYFGNAQREAEEAKDAVLGFADALRESGAVGATMDLQAQFAELEPGVRQAMIDMEFDYLNFAEGIVDGSETAGSAISDMLDNLDIAALPDVDLDEFLNFGRVSRSFEALGNDLQPLLDALDVFQESGALVDFAGIEHEDFGQFLEVLEAAGISAGEFSTIVSYAQTNAMNLTDAMILLGHEDALTALAEGGEDLAVELVTVEEQARRLFNLFDSGVSWDRLFRELDLSGLGLEEQIEAVEGAADLARQALTKMEDAAIEALTGVSDRTLEDALREFRLGLDSFVPEEGVAINAEFLGGDVFQQQLHELENDIASALEQGVRDGSINSEAEFSDYIAGLREGIENSGLPEGIQAQMLAAVNEFAARGALITWDDLTDMEANITQAEVHGRLLAEGLSGSLAARIAEIAASSPIAYEAVFADRGSDAARGGADPFDGILSGLPTSDDGVTGGEGFMGGFGEGISNKEADVTTAVTEVTDAAVRELHSKETTKKAQTSGTAIATAFSTSVSNGDVAAVLAGYQLGRSTATGAALSVGSMYAVGVNLGQAMARGIRDTLGAVTQAAAAVALAAVRVTKVILSMRSPSKVFYDIGRGIGEGFVEGIQDSETSMADAISTAITKAITKATEASAEAVRNAQVGKAIFDALIPSELPGGTSAASILQQRLGLVGQIGDFGTGVRGGASGLLGTRTANSWGAASNAINQIFLGFEDTLSSIRRQFGEVQAKAGEGQVLTPQERSLLTYGAFTLNVSTAGGAANRAAFDEALNSISEWGQMALEQGYGLDQTISVMRQYTDALAGQAQALGFNAAEVNQLVEEYGLSTAALARFRGEVLDLSLWTLAGNVNTSKILEQLQAIRDFGAALIESGTAAQSAVQQMQAYRDWLVSQAVAYGFNAAAIADLVEQIGLSDTALTEFLRQMTEFGNTVSGATPGGQGQGGLEPPVVNQQIYLTAPYGDPSAIGLAIANRVAYESLRS